MWIRLCFACSLTSQHVIHSVLFFWSSVFGSSMFVRSVMVNCFDLVILALVQEYPGWQSFEQVNPDDLQGHPFQLLHHVWQWQGLEDFCEGVLAAPCFGEDEVLIGVLPVSSCVVWWCTLESLPHNSISVKQLTNSHWVSHRCWESLVPLSHWQQWIDQNLDSPVPSFQGFVDQVLTTKIRYF